MISLKQLILICFDLICFGFLIKFVLFLFQQLLDALRCPASTIVRAPWRAEFVLVPKEESCRKMDELVKVKNTEIS
jgi:hypothetical protein